MLVRSLFLPFELEDLVSDNSFKKGFQELNILNELNDDISGLNDTNLSTMYLEIKYFLCSKLLRDCDWVSMAHSVELRTPFVDWFFFKKMIFNKNVSKVSIIGVGMITTPGVTFRMFQALARKNINIQVISTSEIKISVLIKRINATKAVKCLHKEFELDK